MQKQKNSFQSRNWVWGLKNSTCKGTDPGSRTSRSIFSLKWNTSRSITGTISRSLSNTMDDIWKPSTNSSRFAPPTRSKHLTQLSTSSTRTSSSSTRINGTLNNNNNTTNTTMIMINRIEWVFNFEPKSWLKNIISESENLRDFG